MFKTKAAGTRLAQRRLSKARVEQLRSAREQRAGLLEAICAEPPSPERLLEAERLAQRARDAQSAPFLKQYRMA